MRHILYKLILFFFIFLQGSYVFFLKIPGIKTVDTASLTTASATLSNSRMSYRGGITSSPETSGATTINVDTAGSEGDEDTDHLFPNDTICFVNAAETGCMGSRNYTVNTIVDSDTFTMTPSLTTDLAATDDIVATQSGSLTFSFVTTNTIPSNGSILITVPSVNTDSRTNDGFPDTNSTVATNGFDLNGIAAADISTTGCTDGNWVTTETITPGGASSDSTIAISRQTSTCAAGTTITVTIDSNPGIVNPAPLLDSATQGTADIYTFTIATRDGSSNTIDTVDVDVAPVEGVLVSATVDETLTFAIAGVSSATTTCGETPDVTTTAMSVPFGTLINADTFYDASQQLTLSTNADGGYSVKAEENDQMGRNGNTCTGAAAGESVNCIEDTTCDGGSCSESSEDDWETATNNGFGFSLKNQTGSDATFQHNAVSGSCLGTASSDFCARQIADQEATETKQNVMYNAGPVAGSSVYVCYRTTISATQPAGYYYNKVKYTATAIF